MNKPHIYSIRGRWRARYEDGDETGGPVFSRYRAQRLRSFIEHLNGRPATATFRVATGDWLVT